MGYTLDNFGVDFGGYNVTIQFATPAGAKERRTRVESVLASVRWK